MRPKSEIYTPKRDEHPPPLSYAEFPPGMLRLFAHLHCMLLHVVGRCCAKFETRQTFSYAKTDATTTIGDKIVETLFLNRVISGNKRIRTPPLFPPFKVGVFVVFYRQLEQGHNIARRGWGRKAIFPPFQVNKT